MIPTLINVGPALDICFVRMRYHSVGLIQSSGTDAATGTNSTHNHTSRLRVKRGSVIYVFSGDILVGVGICG